MITAFTVKNFKAIGDDPVRIELKPITLLFGANSGSFAIAGRFKYNTIKQLTTSSESFYD